MAWKYNPGNFINCCNFVTWFIIKGTPVENSKKIYTSRGTLDLSSPRVMGILNLTPDSFYDGGNYLAEDHFLERAGQMLGEGADIIDIGAASTRPGADLITLEEELQRLIPALEKIIRHFPGALVSVDTFRSRVAREAIAAGAAIINDVSGGTMDEGMFSLVAELRIPYIMMHIQGTPRDMQKNPQYVDVVSEVSHFFEVQLNKLAGLGVVNNVVIDPGFGFGVQGVDRLVQQQYLRRHGQDCSERHQLLLAPGQAVSEPVLKVRQAEKRESFPGDGLGLLF